MLSGSAGMISSLMKLSSSEQPSHLNDGRVENVENELRGETDGEHEQGHWNDYEFLAPQKVRKRAATFDQRPAEKRLHRTQQNNRRDE